MRSVFLIFEKKWTNNLVDFLDSYCDDSSGTIPPVKQWYVWAYENKASEDICLYIDSYPLAENDFHMNIEDENSFELLLNLDDAVVWAADISGRHAGTLEVLDFVKAFLQKMPAPAYVTDDYTDHFWSYDDLENNLKVEGHTFFDYIGWYYEGQNIKT